MDNFWSYHGIFLLLGLTFFPRISLLLFCNIPYHFLLANKILLLIHWLGWFFLPRIVIAIYATIYYLDTNIILVFLSWIIALSGESAEKSYGYKIKNRKSNKSRDIKYEIINE